jgi:hypothetical protein
MAPTQLTVEIIPASVSVEQRDGSRRLDFSFAIHNAGADDLELVAIEQDVYNTGGALIQLRLVDEAGTPITADAEHGSRIASGESRTIPNPLPDLAPDTPLDALVYRLTFRTAAGRVLQSTIRLASITGYTPPQLTADPTPPTPAANDEQPNPPTPRQLTRSWFETLYALGVYATA